VAAAARAGGRTVTVVETADLVVVGGRRVRLESMPNAIAQARVAAAALAGNPRPYTEVPWFWSDQYDLKLQIAGLHTATTRTSRGCDHVNGSLPYVIGVAHD